MSISGVSSSTSFVNSQGQLPAARASFLNLLTSTGMLATLSAGSSGKAPTARQITAALWSMFDPDGNNKTTKADVQKAMTALGATAQDASALWSQLSPYGLKSVSKAAFSSNAFINSTLSFSMTALK